jgi:uncharacterized protein
MGNKVSLMRKVSHDHVTLKTPKRNFFTASQLSQLAVLADRYSDRNPDLADLCLIRMSEIYPRHSVITVDRTDFNIYRRNKREAIPLICPP